MDWNGLRRKLLAEHSGDPRTLAYMEEAFRLGEESLRLFAQFGHKFHLAPGDGPKLGEWPRLMFHVNSAPNGRMVHSEYELWDLGEGWEDSLEAAQVRDGIMAQFAGRGGVNRRALPTIVEGENAQSAFDSEAEKQTRIEAFKASQKKDQV